MNLYLLAASVTTFLLVVIHSISGELKLLTRIKKDQLPVMKGYPQLWETKFFSFRVIRLTWHSATALGLGMAATMAYLSTLPVLDARDHAILLSMGISFFVCGCMTLILTRGSHVGWIALLLIAVLCVLA